MGAILAALNIGLGLVPTAIEAGVSIVGLIQKMQKVTSSGPEGVSEKDLADLRAENDSIAAQLTALEDKSAAGQ